MTLYSRMAQALGYCRGLGSGASCSCMNDWSAAHLVVSYITLRAVNTFARIQDLTIIPCVPSEHSAQQDVRRRPTRPETRAHGPSTALLHIHIQTILTIADLTPIHLGDRYPRHAHLLRTISPEAAKTRHPPHLRRQRPAIRLRDPFRSAPTSLGRGSETENAYAHAFGKTPIRSEVEGCRCTA